MSDQTVTPAPTPEVSSDDRLWVLLEFVIPLISLITLFLADKKDRPFIKYHTVPTLMLGVIEAILVAIPFIGWLIFLLVWIFSVIVYGLRANKGVYTDIPVLTNLSKGQGWS